MPPALISIKPGKYDAQKWLDNKTLYFLCTFYSKDCILQVVPETVLTFTLLFGVLQDYRNKVAHNHV